MKKAILSVAIALLSLGSVFAAPQFKGLSNKNGNTTIQIEFPASDLSSVTELKDWKLYNNDEELAAKKVSVTGHNGNRFVLEFKKLTEFENCRLTFTMNGKPVSMDIQSELITR